MKANLLSLFAYTAGIFLAPTVKNNHNLGFNKDIVWPVGFHPSESSFYVENDIHIQASPDVVWSILIDAESWPSWYEGAKNVSVSGEKSPRLSQDAILKWETMGLHFDSEIREFETNRKLAWLSRKKSIQGYHIWIISPTETGCRVVTAEAQNGWLTFFEKTFQPKKLHRLHDIWLKELKVKAEQNGSTNP